MVRVVVNNKQGLVQKAGGGTSLDNAVSVSGVLTNSSIVNWNSSEDLANAGAADLTVMTSFFATGGAETSTLAVGSYTGQMKILSCAAHGGNMVTTVTNPSWGGSGTITFTGAGSSCMLIYLNAKWHVVGSHAVTLG
mgnify:CR=1 FL=1|tara:strand:+ start:1329 stop:1739 length:411 start_codon:yes stop_codon:yes gene_type:complete